MWVIAWCWCCWCCWSRASSITSSVPIDIITTKLPAPAAAPAYAYSSALPPHCTYWPVHLTLRPYHYNSSSTYSTVKSSHLPYSILSHVSYPGYLSIMYSTHSVDACPEYPLLLVRWGRRKRGAWCSWLTLCAGCDMGDKINVPWLEGLDLLAWVLEDVVGNLLVGEALVLWHDVLHS